MWKWGLGSGSTCYEGRAQLQIRLVTTILTSDVKEQSPVFEHAAHVERNRLNPDQNHSVECHNRHKPYKAQEAQRDRVPQKSVDTLWRERPGRWPATESVSIIGPGPRLAAQKVHHPAEWPARECRR